MCQCPEAVSHAQQYKPSPLGDQWLAGGSPVLPVLFLPLIALKFDSHSFMFVYLGL